MEKNRIKTVSAIAIIIALTGTVYSASVWASDDSGDQPKQEQAAQESTQPARNDEAARHEKLTHVAKEWGIDITGMNDDQILAALEAEELKRGPELSPLDGGANMQDRAKKMGIDTTGMSVNEVKQAINDKAAKEAKEAGGRRIDKNAMTPEQYHQSLVDVAKEIGIDITGLNDEQIDAALREWKMAHSK